MFTLQKLPILVAVSLASCLGMTPSFLESNSVNAQTQETVQPPQQPQPTATLSKQNNQMDEQFEQMDERFEWMEEQFEQMDEEFEQMDEEMDEEFGQMNEDFEDMNQLMDDNFGLDNMENVTPGVDDSMD